MTRRGATAAHVGAPAVRALAVHARDVPAPEREAFSVAARDLGASSGLILETCHRVEWYGADAAAFERLESSLPRGGQRLAGEDAARHVLRVAAGLDSVVVGEDQILHQLREAVVAARTAGAVDATLDRLLSHALRVGRRVRSWRQGPSRSLADVAIQLVVDRAGPLAEQSVLVVGAGQMGRLAATAASAAGARVLVASRTGDRAASLARSIGTDAGPFEPGAAAGRNAAVIVALRGPWAIGAEARRSLSESSTIVVDLSVPQSVAAELASALGERFVSADALAIGAGEGAPAGDREAALIEEAVGSFGHWLAASGRRTAARALAERAEEERRAALEELWRRLPSLPPESRDQIERMSHHLTERVLRDPLERLGSDADGRHERAVRELWAL